MSLLSGAGPVGGSGMGAYAWPAALDRQRNDKGKPFMKKLAVLFLFFALPLYCQTNTGELRLKVTDPSGLSVKATVQIVSEANEYQHTLATDDQGVLDVRRLPFGIYHLEINQPGFAEGSETVEVRSSIPTDYPIVLKISSATQSVSVTAANTLIDPDQAGSVNQVGSDTIQNRVASIPGRSIQDLVNSQPGWLYEGNAVLHPRGSEYQTQFVIDGIPLTDNRSPSFGPGIEADNLDSINIYTAGFAAEYGRKMGGVVELNTHHETVAGLHGQLVLAGGSYDTASSYGRMQEVWGRNIFGASASGSMTAHYLNPVVPQNYTNNGTTGDFAINYERDLTDRDRLGLSVRHELSRFQIPNELVQQQAGQRQNGDNFETIGTVNYQHILSPDSLGTLAGMVRDNANDLYSNEDSTPIIASQRNDFREGYFKGTFSLHHGNQELKAGIESDTAFLHENFKYDITDPTQFDDDTPPSLSFAASRPDLEQSAFAEDLIRLGNWTISAGLRWDHYQLLLNQNAFSP